MGASKILQYLTAGVIYLAAIRPAGCHAKTFQNQENRAAAKQLLYTKYG
jgi:hypothetical protein